MHMRPDFPVTPKLTRDDARQIYLILDRLAVEAAPSSRSANLRRLAIEIEDAIDRSEADEMEWEREAEQEREHIRREASVLNGQRL